MTRPLVSSLNLDLRRLWLSVLLLDVLDKKLSFKSLSLLWSFKLETNTCKHFSYLIYKVCLENI